MKPILRHVLQTLVLLCLASTGCTAPRASPFPEAPGRTVVGGRGLVIDVADLWRDFMPIGPVEGSPLMAFIRVRTDDAGPFPAEVVVERITVRHGADVWTELVKERRSSAQDAQEVVIRGGPRWGPEVNVDVLHLRDAEGREHRLRAMGVRIDGTF